MQLLRRRSPQTSRGKLHWQPSAAKRHPHAILATTNFLAACSALAALATSPNHVPAMCRGGEKLGFQSWPRRRGGKDGNSLGGSRALHLECIRGVERVVDPPGPKPAASPQTAASRNTTKSPHHLPLVLRRCCTIICTLKMSDLLLQRHVLLLFDESPLPCSLRRPSLDFACSSSATLNLVSESVRCTRSLSQASYIDVITRPLHLHVGIIVAYDPRSALPFLTPPAAAASATGRMKLSTKGIKHQTYQALVLLRQLCLPGAVNSSSARLPSALPLCCRRPFRP